jgi:superfamily I DNA/RNA helicase
MFDDLIVDEGQDFKNTWSENLMRLLRSNSKVWWLEDPLQNIYSRDQISFENWVTIRSDANYRSPKSILYAINEILHLNPSIAAASPIEGGEVELLEYTNESDLVTKTIQAIDRAVEIGFNKKLISLLTFRGRDKSLFTPFTQIGAHTLRAPIKDAFDDEGNQQFTEGEITTDSVHRFKGQSCPCVILTEIDFEELTENVKSRVFVGATRATIKLILVVSSSSLRKLLN